MLVDASKLKQLRQQRNWTQQYLADACDVNIRTIQRVEKDGVASNETLAAFAAVFEIDAQDVMVSLKSHEESRSLKDKPFYPGLIFIGGFSMGAALMGLALRFV